MDDKTPRPEDTAEVVLSSIPRDYNAAHDLLQRHLQAGRADQVGADRAHDGIDVVGAPGLGGVVGSVVVGDDARPVVGGAASKGVADAEAAADTGDEHRPARQGQQVAASGADLVVGVVLMVSLGGHGSECRRGGAGGPAVSVLDAREPAGEGLVVGLRGQDEADEP